MTEPIYEYVKGQGWVINTYPLMTFRNGTYRLEARLPDVGEFYSQCGKGNGDGFVIDGEVNLQRFVEHYEPYQKSDIASSLLHRSSAMSPDEDYYFYVTFVRV